MHRVVALVKPVQPMFELACVIEVFGTARTGIPQRYILDLCAETVGSVPTSSGLAMAVPQGLSALRSADTVVIPGWLPVNAPLSSDVRDALLSAHERGARIVTICSGVFALAHTGLLAGRSATTHSARVDQLQREFPDLRVRSDVLFVDHGDVATSAGAGAGIDLCLHLVGRDQGFPYAARIAESMVVPLRTGNHMNASTSVDEFDQLIDWVESQLGSRLTVEELAAHLNVSPRTLARRFADRLGTSPGAWLLSRRVAYARTLLERTDLSVEAIAMRAGFGSPVNFRRRFRAALDITPGAYRQHRCTGHWPE